MQTYGAQKFFLCYLKFKGIVLSNLISSLFRRGLVFVLGMFIDI